MDLPQSSQNISAPSSPSTFTVYRTPSSRDAADTAHALNCYPCPLDFLPPAGVVQSAPGIYEVRVTCASREGAGNSLAALQKVLSQILLARLECPLTFPPLSRHAQSSAVPNAAGHVRTRN